MTYLNIISIVVFLKQFLISTSSDINLINHQYFSIPIEPYNLMSFYIFVRYGMNNNKSSIGLIRLFSINLEAYYSFQGITYVKNSDEPDTFNLFKNDVEISVYNKNLQKASKIMGTEYSDIIRLGEEQMKDFHLLVPYKNSILEPSFKLSSLAFAHRVSPRNHSLVHMLYENKKIVQKVFAIYIDKSNKSNSQLFLGGLPTNLTSTYNNKMELNVPNKKSVIWETTINYIFIGNISYVYQNIYTKIESRAKVSSQEMCIKLPKETIEIIFDEWFNSPEINDFCSVTRNNYSVSCACGSLDSIPQIRNGQINFIVNGNQKIMIKAKDLFMKQDRGVNCQLNINITEPIEEYKVILGAIFISQFLTEFSYDSNKIILYSNDISNFKFMDMDILFPGRKIKKFFVALFVIIVLIFLVREGLRLWTSRKRRKYNKYLDMTYHYLKK